MVMPKVRARLLVYLQQLVYSAGRMTSRHASCVSRVVLNFVAANTDVLSTCMAGCQGIQDKMQDPEMTVSRNHHVKYNCAVEVGT